MDAILHGVLVDFSVNYKGLINFFYFSVIFYFFPPLAYVFRFSGDEKHRNKNVWPNKATLPVCYSSLNKPIQSNAILRLKALFEYCDQLCLMVRYGTGQIRDSARRDTNTQTNKHTNTKLKLCGPWLAPEVTEVTSSA